MVIVDTTVWIDYLAGTPSPQAQWLDREMTTRRLGLLDLMVCEVLQGVGTEGQASAVLAGLRRFEIFDTGGVELAVAAAANYRALRTRGRTVRKTIDTVIATFCILGGHALLHNDRDFDAFEEHLRLQVVRV